jgi:hypothetical protein
LRWAISNFLLGLALNCNPPNLCLPSSWKLNLIRIFPINNHQEVFDVARHWWLTPVILATQKAEIRRITV